MEDKYKKALEEIMKDSGLEWCEECQEWVNKYHRGDIHNN